MARGKGGRKDIRIEAPMEEMNLSPEEMEQYRRATGRPRGPSVSSEDGKVSQKVHEDTVKELNEKIQELQAKLDEVKEERNSFRDEREDYKKRFEKKQEDLDGANTTIQQLRTENSGLRNENSDLRSDLNEARKQKTPSSDAVKAEKLAKDVKELEEKLKEAQNEVEDLKTKLGESESRVGELSELLEKSRLEPAPVEPARGPVGKVIRSAPEILESDLFSESRYTIWLSRDGHTLKITPDVEGRALCEDRRMTLPRLRLLLPYDGRAEYEAYRDGSGIILSLRRSGT